MKFVKWMLEMFARKMAFGASISRMSVQRVKTRSSVRFVPIHPKLIEFGLLDFRNSRPDNGKLFGDISRGSDGCYSSTFFKRVNRHFEKIGVHGPKHKFHSLRHNFKDALRSGLVDPGIARALGGSMEGGMVVDVRLR